MLDADKVRLMQDDDAQATKKRIGGLQYAVQKQTSDDATEAAAKAEESAHLHIGSNYGGGIVFYLD